MVYQGVDDAGRRGSRWLAATGLFRRERHGAALQRLGQNPYG